MIYLKSFRITAPFNNKGLHQLCATFLIPYLTKELEFATSGAKQLLVDKLTSYSNSFEERVADFRLGKFTLADFGTTTQIGDFSEVFYFCVMSLEKPIVDKVAKGAFRVCKETIEHHSDKADQFNISEIIETKFPLEGTVTEKLNHQEKVDKWIWLLDNFPYCDKIFEWLLNNRHYPTVQVA